VRIGIPASDGPGYDPSLLAPNFVALKGHCLAFPGRIVLAKWCHSGI